MRYAPGRFSSAGCELNLATCHLAGYTAAMRIIRGLHNIPQSIGPTVVTIGNFDGVHLGHQQLLAKVVALAAQHQATPVVLTFEPQPNEFFHHGKPQARLMRLREKVQGLKPFGIAAIVCARFSNAFAAMPATEFVQSLLVDQLQAKAVVIGDDFRFGAKRQGDVALLQTLGQQHGFSVTQCQTHEINGARVSSTRVRHALDQGDLALTHKLLGRAYSLWGRVAHGDRRGRELGFPTANIYLHRQWVPVSGVFAVRIHGLDNQCYNGVANVGVRPTF